MTSKSRVGLQQWPLVPTPYVASMPSAPKNDETIVDMSSPYHKSKKRQVPWVPIPSGWKRHVHPSGWIYFEKPEARIITDYPMGSPELQAALNKLDTEDSETIPEEFELWIGQSAQDADIVYIDHERRRALPNLKSDESDIEDHMKTDEDRTKHLRLELSYWRYLAEHPCHARLPPNVEEDALAILSFFIQDRILNPEDSVVPFSKETSKELMDLLSAMTSDKSYASNARNSHVKTHFVSRLMERIVDERLRQHYGEEGARRYLKKGRHARVIQDAKSPWAIDLLLDFCMVFLFFGTPFAYLRHVNEFFITALGRTETISEKWRAFVDENVTDWSDTNLVATVLVSAAVGFLAVPGIDDISRLFALFSILFALSSLIAGLLNAWQHQHESRASLELTIIMNFFSQAERPLRTYKILALLLALPMALLIWATVSFAVSITIFSWHGLDTTFVQNNPDFKSRTQDGVPEAFEFTKYTGIATTSVACVGGLLVVVSLVYFWHVWTPPNPNRWHKRK